MPLSQLCHNWWAALGECSASSQGGKDKSKPAGCCEDGDVLLPCRPLPRAEHRAKYPALFGGV